MLALIGTIVIIYLLYYIWIVINFDKRGEQRKPKKEKKSTGNNKSNKKKKIPAEMEFFVVKYKVDLDKVNYRYFLQLMALVISFDLGIVITIVSYLDGLWLQLLVGLVLVLIFVLVSYKLLGNYFKKKGLTKDV